MAGDWIKMRSGLQTHPKVVRIMSALKADRLRVIGGLHAVWCLFDEHSTDGTLEGYTTEAIDSLIGWPGFSVAMESVGWLEDNGESLCTPRFDEHNGQSAKRRAQESERKRIARNAPEPSAPNADNLRTREEKRREDISTTTVVEKAPRTSASGSRLPADWQCPDEWIDDAIRIKPAWTRVSALVVADGFRDYWVAVAGAKGRKVDWRATWRNWVRNQREIATTSPPGRPNLSERREATISALTGRAPQRNQPAGDLLAIEGDSHRVA